MRKIFEDELSLDDVKAIIKKWKKHDTCKSVCIAVGVIVAIAALATIAFVLIKKHFCNEFDELDDDFDDDFEDDFDDEDNCGCKECKELGEDENGCQFADEKDFE